ncbi:beta-ketoacyl-[acyl-carrier-protein] synthase family protein [Vibrio rhizosphaerae]|uniref:Beta-ketoacyl-[acyl-carrier-protein] synthase family protein n=1 Tax=Vibrio rhizosphaerae TaxID=398736 RepID=A0ABU4IQZ8_9VIBR|nr:beta-ketoacyl-[acyl-carrier-protein] synthase family protein [Vibrio rhizosphaerae]MDW6091679.1 beta-ketoacyl-[acyl-carrier-protein] synthase family protein [Vibrio rhizosphaerae]
MRHVVITGLGVCVPTKRSPDNLFQALFNRESLIHQDNRLESFGINNFVCAAMQPSDISYLDENYPELAKHNVSTSGKMAYHALLEAKTQAGLEVGAHADRRGLFFGVNKNLISPEQIHRMYMMTKKSASESYDGKTDYLPQRPDEIVKLMSEQLQVNQPILVCSDACAAGSSNILAGMRRIRNGDLDVAFCGAADEGSQPMMQLVFHKIGAVGTPVFSDPQEVCRPFDQDRNGCVLADGAAFLVLEAEETALARGARILARLSGGSRGSEAYKITASKSDGSYYALAMQQALNDACLTSDEIDHINAHGTATKSNDAAEGRAIHQLFKEQVPVTSTKSALGHSLAGSGALEAVLSVLSLDTQKMLPTLNYIGPAEGEAELNIVSQASTAKMDHILSNSFGFGGLNTSLIFSRGDI